MHLSVEKARKLAISDGRIVLQLPETLELKAFLQ